MKKGSTLVENIVALSILLIAATIAIEITIVSINSKKVRKEKEKANRVIYAIENEIKYNLKINDLNELFKKGKINYNYSEDILEELTKKPILNIQSGEGIEIEKIDDIIIPEYEEMPIILLRVRILDNNGGVLNEREFIKSYWMEKY